MCLLEMMAKDSMALASDHRLKLHMLASNDGSSKSTNGSCVKLVKRDRDASRSGKAASCMTALRSRNEA